MKLVKSFWGFDFVQFKKVTFFYLERYLFCGLYYKHILTIVSDDWQ